MFLSIPVADLTQDPNFMIGYTYLGEANLLIEQKCTDANGTLNLTSILAASDSYMTTMYDYYISSQTYLISSGFVSSSAATKLQNLLSELASTPGTSAQKMRVFLALQI